MTTETPGQLWDRITILELRLSHLEADSPEHEAAYIALRALTSIYYGLTAGLSEDDWPEWLCAVRAWKVRTTEANVSPPSTLPALEQALRDINRAMWNNEAHRDTIISGAPAPDTLPDLLGLDRKEQLLNQNRHAVIDSIDDFFFYFKRS